MARIMSTTDGRQRLPGLLQDVYGHQTMVGFDRYGRALGALVSMEAVAILAGQPVSAASKARAAREAKALLSLVG